MNGNRYGGNHREGERKLQSAGRTAKGESGYGDSHRGSRLKKVQYAGFHYRHRVRLCEDTVFFGEMEEIRRKICERNE